MRVHVVAFASAADILGRESLEIELPEGSRLDDLKEALLERFPTLVPTWTRLAVAVDGVLGAADAELADGSEVALLPPVSGGSDLERPAVLVEGPIDLAEVAATVAAPERGAVLLFVGNVRDHHQGRAVEELTYQAYRRMAERAIERIVEELEAATEGLRVMVVHRLGRVSAGETSVVIAVASPHRHAAYAASREALERLKREVPIWKREHFVDGDWEWREVEPLGSVPGAGSPDRG